MEVYVHCFSTEVWLNSILADYSLFTMTIVNGEFSALLVYVDDIVIASTTIQAVNHVKQYLSFQFKLKDLGTLKYFLGLEIARS